MKNKVPRVSNFHETKLRKYCDLEEHLYCEGCPNENNEFGSCFEGDNPKKILKAIKEKDVH